MIFIDTSAWICLFDKRPTEKLSIAAKQFFSINTGTLAVTDLIIEETHKWLVHHQFPPKNALQILKGFVSQEFAQILSVEENDRMEATLLVEKYLDQKLSYTDAISVTIMRRANLKKIFSFDRDFDLFRGIERVPK